MGNTSEISGEFRWRQLVPYLKGSRVVLVVGLFLGTLDAAAQACLPLFFRYVLNRVQSDAGAFMEDGIWTTLGIGAALLVVFLPIAYYFHVMTTVAIMRLCRNLQVDLYSHVQRLSMDFFQRFRVGEINSRLNADLEALSGGAGLLAALAWAPALLLSSLAMMFWIDWRLALVSSAMLAAIGLSTVFMMPRIKRWNRNVRDASGEVSATVTEYVGIFSLLKAYSREDLAENNVRAKSDLLLQRREEVTRWQSAYMDIMQTFTRFAGPLLILFVGAYWIHGGSLLAGDLAAFWGYWLQLSGVVQGIVFSFSGLMGSIAALDRIFAFFRETSLVKDPAVARNMDGVRGEVTFRDVSFRYPMVDDAEGPVLTGVDLTIRAGERLALVGPSGAGKSTLLTLLLRFYDPDKGAVLLDGVDLREFSQRDLRRELGVVMQESLFFSGSIADNLRLAKPESSDAELWAALEAANAAEFVREMSGGLDTPLGERGTKLSGGQRQRLSIARVFLKDPRLVMFDEPTSALDSQSERHIKEAMKRLLDGRTSITVAHRLATVIDADRIIVMNKGRIIAQGKHDELRETCPLYADLCAKQGLGG